MLIVFLNSIFWGFIIAPNYYDDFIEIQTNILQNGKGEFIMGST